MLAVPERERLCGRHPADGHRHGVLYGAQEYIEEKAAALDGTPHIKRPDADNLAKAILDALNGHAYNDDSAIAMLTVRKYQTTGASRVEVIIEEAE